MDEQLHLFYQNQHLSLQEPAEQTGAGEETNSRLAARSLRQQLLTKKPGWSSESAFTDI